MYLLSMSLWFMTVLLQGIAKQCTLPELPNFSKPLTTEQDNYDEDAHFYYSCVHNYHFEKPGTDRHKIVCSNGHWAPKPFWKCTDDCKNKCDHGTCKKTVDPETRETVAFCLCHKNYAGERCDARVCEVPLKLHHLSPTPRSTIGDGKYPLGKIITFRCAEGYAIKTGRNQAKCKPGGWDPSIPECEKVSCPGQSFPHGSHSPVQTMYNVGSSVRFSCQSGYKLIGSSSSNCHSNGQWYHKWPTCFVAFLRVCTDAPPRVQHGFIIGPNHPPYTVGTEVQYRCQSRYYIEGRNIIKCKLSYVDPVWEHPPRCYPIDACGDSDKIIQKKEDGMLYCVPKGPLITTTVSSTVKPLTIVTATAGALLLLLLIVISLVAYQRRRIAISNRRQDRVQLNPENDRYSFVYYTNDVHVVLPSYDEAVGVQGAPPPYGGPDASENTSNEQGREEVATGSELNQEDTEIVYEAIDETLRASYSQRQTNENNPHSSAGHNVATNETNEHTSISSERNDSNVLHKEVDTASDIDSVISLNIEDPVCDDTAPLIEE